MPALVNLGAAGCQYQSSRRARKGTGLCLRSKTWCLDFTHRGERHVARLGKNISRTVLQVDQPKAEHQSAIDQAHRRRHQAACTAHEAPPINGDRKSTRLNSSHLVISYAVFCLKKKKKQMNI